MGRIGPYRLPTFEDGGTHVNVSGVAMTKSAPNRDAALQLMQFLAGEEAQRIYAETNNEFPVTEGVERSELVASWGDFTADDLTLTEISDLRPQALDLIERVNFDGDGFLRRGPNPPTQGNLQMSAKGAGAGLRLFRC